MHKLHISFRRKSVEQYAKKYIRAAKEFADVIIAVHNAAEDEKVTPEEVQKIVLEAKEAYEFAKTLIK